MVRGSMLSKGLAMGMIMALCLFTGTAVFAQTQEDIQKYPSCKYCGMDRQKFDFSRVLIEYDDGTVVGLCSVHCAAVDLAMNIDKTPKSIMVGDMNTKQLVDVEAATWVVGGSKPGVMTKRAKWAFAKKEDAESFAKANGGTMGSFDEAMKATYEDMYADTKMIREKRKMMKSKSQEHQHQEQKHQEHKHQ